MGGPERPVLLADSAPRTPRTRLQGRRGARQLGLLWVVAAALTWGEVAWGQSVLPDGTVRFETGSSRLTAESEKVLDRLAALLRRRPDLDPIELVGHADDRGTEAVNQALSQQRAATVRDALVGRGIRTSRMLVRGAGSQQPLSAADTEAARSLNRRVEVWVTPPNQVATVTKIYRKVQSKEVAAPKWKAARINMGLRRLARVRTERESASEVTFEQKDRVSLGPESLIVIYDTPVRAKKSKHSVADIEIQQGTLFAALAARERTLTVNAKASAVKVRSTRTRIDVRTTGRGSSARPLSRKRKNAVSVYDGQSDVTAVGQTVQVKEGYGTQVMEGQPPEPPRPLPPAPAWASKLAIVTHEGRPLGLAWRLNPRTEWAEVQIGAGPDRKVERPIALWRVKGTTTGTKAIAQGTYRVRLAGVDGDLVGASGPTATLVVLPPPESGQGPVTFQDDVLRLPAPGVLQQSVPTGARLTLAGRSSTVAVEVAMLVPGRHLLDATIESEGQQTRRRIPVEVGPAELRVDVSPSVLNHDRSETKVRVVVNTPAGQGLPGFTWRAGVVPEVTERLQIDANRKGRWQDCRCRLPPQTTPLSMSSAGVYEFQYTAPAPETARSVVLRIMDPRGPVAVEVPVSLAVKTAVTRAETKVPPRVEGWYGGLRVGAMLLGGDAPRPRLDLELGRRFRLTGKLDLDLAAVGGGFARTTDDGDVGVFPLLGRITFGLRTEGLRPYTGVGGGVRWLRPDDGVGGMLAVFAGLGVRMGGSEVIIEAGYELAERPEGVTVELAGWTATIGYRFGSWFYPR